MCPGVTYVPGRKCHLCIGTFTPLTKPLLYLGFSSLYRETKFFLHLSQFNSAFPSAFSAYSAVCLFSVPPCLCGSTLSRYVATSPCHFFSSLCGFPQCSPIRPFTLPPIRFSTPFICRSYTDFHSLP